MLFMVIERFKDSKKEAVYNRYQTRGRMLPEGLQYVSSWVEVDGDRCFQVMEADHPGLFDEWIEHWDDLVDFEIVAVTDSPTTG